MRVSWRAMLLAAVFAPASSGAETRRVVAGPQYQASGFHEVFFGADYRDLWAAPIEVEVLDLSTFAGGLTPVRRVGGMQTRSLALKGADGRAYTFRSLDKDPSAALPPDLQGTVATRVIQDQTSGGHPAGSIVASGLLEAAGVLHTEPRLVVLPDDAALGEFRAVFAGVIGTIEEYPTVGFKGATEVLSPADAWTRFEASPADRPDAEAFLRVRLMDLLMGDWDRHRNQWRWARVPDRRDWQPIPEDRDQAFARYEGVLPWIARSSFPKIVVFGPDYPNLEGLTFNGWEHDRRILSTLDWSEWEPVIADLEARLTDAVIDAAIARQPAPYQELDGRRMREALHARRGRLRRVARRFYERLAREVDLRLTDAAEDVQLVQQAGGQIELTVSAADSDGPFLRRRLQPGDTDEVRLHLRGGDDTVVTSGGRSRILVRVVGGAGEDTLDDSAGGGAQLFDSDGRLVAGPGTHHDRGAYAPPAQKYPWDYTRDWGSWAVPVPWVAASPDLGLFIGGGLKRVRYGFRKEPWAESHLVRVGWATTAQRGRIEYTGDFPRQSSRHRLDVALRASGIEILRFHGFGNETSVNSERDFYKAEQRQYMAAPAMTFGLGPRATLSVGPVVQYASTDLDPGRFITLTRPYGSEPFGQAGARLGLTWDSRNHPSYPERGVFATLENRTFPSVWDVQDTFGSVRGEVSAYATAGGRVTLAARAGGKRVFGTYPFHEAAFVGGPDTVRGFVVQRFAGDSALWGSAELRAALAHFFFLVPGELGVFGLADAGRVFLEGESSDRWHTSAGGGIWIAILNRRQTVSLAIAKSRERTSVYFRGGMAF